MIFVPFVLESLGALGKEAAAFLRDLSKETVEPHQFYIYALRRIAVALQRGNAQVQRHGQVLIRRSATRRTAHQPMVEIVKSRSQSEPASSLPRSISSADSSQRRTHVIALPLPPVPPAIRISRQALFNIDGGNLGVSGSSLSLAPVPRVIRSEFDQHVI